MTPVSKSDAESRVKALYYIMQSSENKLGGGEGIEGLYGSLTRSGMHKVLHSLSKSCGLNHSSRLVDIGAGLGRPLLHALIHPGVASGFGIEIDQIKCSKAHAFLQQSAAALFKRGIAGKDLHVPVVKCSPIEKVLSLDPATHAYSFWEGVPVDAKCAFGALFAASRTLKAVAVVQRAMRQADPAEVMAELGFGEVHLVSSFAVSMSGSGRSFTAYVFVKSDRAQQAQRNSLADVSAAQPISPQLLAAQRLVAESPSPISTPEMVAASRILASQIPANGKTVATVSISVDATGVALQPSTRSGTGKHQAGKHDVATSSCGATEGYADQERTETGPDEGGATEEAATRPGASRLVRHVRQSKQSQEPSLPVQATRRSQRQQQQQQRQLKEKQVQAEQQHTSRIRTQVSTAVSVATPSVRHSANRTTSCTVISRSHIRQSSADVQTAVSNENDMQQQKQQPQYQQGWAQGNAGKAAASSGGIGRRGRSSPTVGVKKQTSPVGKGSNGGLALGTRFPLRVRKNVEQPSMKGDLNGKFAQACQNHGLGDLASHCLAHKAV